MVSPDSTRVVAAFDVDGTLTSRDCVLPYLVHVASWPKVLLTAARHPLILARAVVNRGGRAGAARDQAKEAMVGGVLAGRRLDDLDAAGREFAAIIAARWLRDDTVSRLEWHRSMDHRVVLVSASLRSYLAPLAADHLGGVDAVLCTDVEIDPDGMCTGRLAGANCRGQEKARRLQEWLDGEPGAEAVLWAYGDSAGDDALLALAHHPVRVERVLVAREPVVRT
jgi:phosphatidylglycerophosphatase C